MAMTMDDERPTRNPNALGSFFSPGGSSSSSGSIHPRKGASSIGGWRRRSGRTQETVGSPTVRDVEDPEGPSRAWTREEKGGGTVDEATQRNRRCVWWVDHAEGCEVRAHPVVQNKCLEAATGGGKPPPTSCIPCGASHGARRTTPSTTSIRPVCSDPIHAARPCPRTPLTIGRSNATKEDEEEKSWEDILVVRTRKENKPKQRGKKRNSTVNDRNFRLSTRHGFARHSFLT
eukprot:scaffold348_cov329-Pavlova_lutheri.AAC.5